MRILDALGIDPDDFTWRDLGLCISTEQPEWFYDDYEHSENVAKNADEMCLSCPVMKACAEAGQTNKEQGLWGGIYWDGSGKPDKDRNAHKTPEVWERIKERLSE